MRRFGFGTTGPGECRGCAPAKARDHALVCDRCFHRLRRLIDEAPDLVGHIRSIADPTKAAVYDRVVVATSKPEAPAPVSAELVDASADIVATLQDWAASITGDVDGYRLPPGAAADEAHDAARWRADIILDAYDTIANTVEITALAEAVLTRHQGDSGLWAWWSIADALARWPLEDRPRWATVPCSRCDLRMLRVLPLRTPGAKVVLVCETPYCEWEAAVPSEEVLRGVPTTSETEPRRQIWVRNDCCGCARGADGGQGLPAPA